MTTISPPDIESGQQVSTRQNKRCTASREWWCAVDSEDQKKNCVACWSCCVILILIGFLTLLSWLSR